MPVRSAAYSIKRRKDKYMSNEPKRIPPNKKWKLKNTDKVNEYKKKNYAQTQNAKYAFKRWTPKDIKMIMDREYTDRELSKILGRSMESIQVKRAKVNKALNEGVIKKEQIIVNGDTLEG